ncbi:ty3-gypsy retrotransposon protein [Cucumis melo var. makuwa]|uniref:Ty3-gypsy retrotransposon protein n=1 Tax=Cucumis melo var. makuwa TaxID=1194695 RepID=A0A5D3BVP8_CUCMM|nr:ty3-gypsy retrotransposon protein [Cucumis melo var. makuwa]
MQFNMDVLGRVDDEEVFKNIDCVDRGTSCIDVGISELTLKFSGFTAGLIGDSSPLLRGDSLGVDSIKGHNQVSGKGFLTTGPRIEAGNVVTHMGIIRNVTVNCSLCAIICNELFTDRHRCPDVLCIVVMLVDYVVNWYSMSMDYKVLRLCKGTTRGRPARGRKDARRPYGRVWFSLYFR